MKSKEELKQLWKDIMKKVHKLDNLRIENDKIVTTKRRKESK